MKAGYRTPVSPKGSWKPDVVAPMFADATSGTVSGLETPVHAADFSLLIAAPSNTVCRLCLKHRVMLS